MQAILVHRIICMYSRSRVVLFGLLVGYAAIFISGMVLAGLSMQSVGIPTFFSPSLRICIPGNIPKAGVANPFLMMAFDLAMFVLAMAEGIRYIQRTRTADRFLQAPGIVTGPSLSKRGPLIHVLLRDSIVFPLINLLICVFNILAFYALPEALPYMLVITSASFPALGCRLVLHLRDAYYRPFKDEFDQSEHSELRIEMPAFAMQSTTFERGASRTSSGTTSLPKL
ncbi:hypothetical protein EST38_g1933 [Candolleomyces aberdarensis]|uniref:G protein-coupled receptor n=1 Tax=Candolleomyces aberdarensis TaxID=2316362 RepID=A0A4V1Q506_9AGAR|nr:hypothetical protein EST38_g1933 [Candolleomyces aberdarensis]